MILRLTVDTSCEGSAGRPIRNGELLRHGNRRRLILQSREHYGEDVMNLVPVWLWLNAHGTHDDLQLELGDLRHMCCSCNLLLDTTLTHQTDAFGALARFLQLWIGELAMLDQHPGETFSSVRLRRPGLCLAARLHRRHHWNHR